MAEIHQGRFCMQLSPYETNDSRRRQSKPENDVRGIPAKARPGGQGNQKRRKSDHQGNHTQIIDRNLTAFFLAFKDQEHGHTGGDSKNAIGKKHRSPTPELKNGPADCWSSRPAQCDGGRQQSQSAPSVIVPMHGGYDRRGHWSRHSQTERHDAPRREQVRKGSGERRQTRSRRVESEPGLENRSSPDEI